MHFEVLLFRILCNSAETSEWTFLLFTSANILQIIKRNYEQFVYGPCVSNTNQNVRFITYSLLVICQGGLEALVFAVNLIAPHP